MFRSSGGSKDKRERDENDGKSSNKRDKEEAGALGTTSEDQTSGESSENEVGGYGKQRE